MLPSMDRTRDCPALPICSMLGNARNACCAGCPTSDPMQVGEKCISGLVLLLARGQGLYTESMEEKLQEKQRIGFVLSYHDPEDN